MIANIIISVLLLFSTIITLSIDSNFDIANIHFYIFILIAIVDFFKNRSFSLLSVWIVAFIYIIITEMLLANYGPDYSWAHKFIFISNNIVILGYIYGKDISKNDIDRHNTSNDDLRESSYFTVSMASLYILFLIVLIPHALTSLRFGARSLENTGEASSNIFVSTLLNTYKVLPIILGFYIVKIKKKSKWIALIFSLPIIFLLIVDGTRFYLLFSLLPFLLICRFLNIGKITLGKIIQITLFVGVFLWMSDFIMNTRNTGIEDISQRLENKTTVNSDYLSVKICSHGSSEGVVFMVNLIKKHFDVYDHTYGMSTGFFLYFWIPRSIWPNKPEMLNHWLPHMYMGGFADNHSTASSFCGEPYADFGYFSVILFFVVGILLKKGNNYLRKYRYGDAISLHSLFAAQLIPYVFFAVRSPITATYQTIMQLAFIYIYYKYFFIKSSKKLPLTNDVML